MTDLERPVVVAVPPVGEATWSGWGPVGVLRFRDGGQPRIAIAVRVVSPFPEDGGPLLPGFPLPPGSPPAPLEEVAPLEGRELVPFKAACDVALVGVVRRPGVHVGPHAMPIELAIGETRRDLTVALVDGRADLATAAATLAGAEVRLGAAAIEPVDDDGTHEQEEGAERFQSAAPGLRFPWPTAGDRVLLRSDAVTVDSTLGFDVFVRVDYLDDTVSLPVVRCDAVTFDLGRREVSWVFRGVVIDPAGGREIERVVVGALAPGGDEERSRVDAWLPHAAFSHATRPPDVRERRHPRPMEEDELAMARYSTWDLGPAASLLPIEVVAQVQVELLRGRPRGEVLEAHGLDPYLWDLEERAAMERVAEAGAAGIAVDEEVPHGEDQGEELLRYREAYAEALATTPSARAPMTPAELAELAAALEVDDPIAVLQRAGLTPGDLVDLQMTMEARFEQEPAARRAFDERYEQALAERQAARDAATPSGTDEQLEEDEA